LIALVLCNTEIRLDAFLPAAKAEQALLRIEAQRTIVPFAVM
jgi:hypothetical protein